MYYKLKVGFVWHDQRWYQIAIRLHGCCPYLNTWRRGIKAQHGWTSRFETSPPQSSLNKGAHIFIHGQRRCLCLLFSLFRCNQTPRRSTTFVLVRPPTHFYKQAVTHQFTWSGVCCVGFQWERHDKHLVLRFSFVNSLYKMCNLFYYTVFVGI